MTDVSQLTDEEKQELLQTYQEAVTEQQDESDKFDPLNHRGPSEKVIQRLHERLLEIFSPTAPHIYVPYQAIETVYDEIQTAEDQYAKYLSNHQIRKFVRIWMSYHAKNWADRNQRTYNHMRARFKYGNESCKLNGYGKVGEFWINADTQTWPERCLYEDRRYTRIKNRANANTAGEVK